MKRKIEDYKNKFVAIFCSSIEKWNKVNDLLGKKGLTQSYGDINKPDNTFVDCIHINGMGTGSKKYYEQQTYVIYPASDFLEEEFKFEEGKWYKNIGKDDKAYAKCKKFEKNQFYLSDHIGHDKRYRLYTDGSYFSKENYKNAELLTDLSEIQEALPEEHPDKIKTEIIPEYVEYIDTKYKGKIVKVEDWCCGSYCKVIFYNGIKEQPFKHLVKPSTKETYEAQNKPKQLNVKDLIKGEIYVFDINSTKNFISKFDYIESDNYYDSCFIQGDDFDNDPEFATISDIKSIRLATNEEKKWLNTCISQDKFISKEDLHLYDDSGLLIWEIGCYYKLNFTDNTSTYIKLSKKVDDRIYGNEYTDSTGKWYYNEIIWSTKQLKTHEKVDKPDQKIKDMFKKDDYIYVLGGETTTGKNCKDKVLKIESVDLKSLNKPFVTTDYDECGGIYFDEIRMATATEINTLYIHKKEEQDMKSILEEAKERYPIGTKFKSVVTRNLFTVESHVNEANNSNIAFHTIESNSSGNHWGCVYEKGTWAEIISLPNEIPITSNCILYNGENISKSFEVSQYYEFDGKSFNQDIYIAPITKKTKKLQTITIESTTDLNLNLTKIKSKQIQTIKI